MCEKRMCVNACDESASKMLEGKKECERRNCSWTEWEEWTPCSRSCGVGQQQRLRTFMPPGTNGTWCADILGGNTDARFCNIRACRGE